MTQMRGIGELVLPLPAMEAVETICRDVGVNPASLYGQVRDRDLCAVRRQCWLRLRAQYGLRTKQIANAFGVSSPAVSQALGSRSQQPNGVGATHVGVSISKRAHGVLRSAARQRETSVERLVAQLVEQIATDDLFDAVLDDSEAA